MRRESFACACLVALSALSASGTNLARALPAGPQAPAVEPSLPACVEIEIPRGDVFVFANRCSQTLTLTAVDCDTCTVPEPIPANGVGIFEFEENFLATVDWRIGSEAGTATFSRQFLAGGCSVSGAASDESPSMPLGVLGLAALALAALRRREPTS